jgi:hypothetical protein
MERQMGHLYVDEYTRCPAEGNFCDTNGKAIKPQIVMDYSHHMGYVDKGDRMASCYSIGHHTWKWTKELFFHLVDLAILNSFVILSLCGDKKISHRDFRFALMRNMLALADTRMGCTKAIRWTTSCCHTSQYVRSYRQQALALSAT